MFLTLRALEPAHRMSVILCKTRLDAPCVNDDDLDLYWKWAEGGSRSALWVTGANIGLPNVVYGCYQPTQGQYHEASKTRASHITPPLQTASSDNRISSISPQLLGTQDLNFHYEFPTQLDILADLDQFRSLWNRDSTLLRSVETNSYIYEVRTSKTETVIDSDDTHVMGG